MVKQKLQFRMKFKPGTQQSSSGLYRPLVVLYVDNEQRKVYRAEILYETRLQAANHAKDQAQDLVAKLAADWRPV